MAAVGDGSVEVGTPAAPKTGMDLMEALRETLKNSIIADGITKGNPFFAFC